MALLGEEFNMGKITRLDEQTHNRLVEFAKPDETYPDLIIRLLDIAAAEASSKVPTATTKRTLY